MALGTFKNLGNNVVIQKMDYSLAGNFTDENKLFNLLGGTESTQRHHLGTLNLFNQMQLINTPLLNMTELAKNTIYVNGDNGEFTFDVPYTGEMPTVKEDLTGDNQKVGIDGQTFEVLIGDGKLDNAFGVNEHITANLRDGQEFEVVEVGQKTGEGFIYKLKLVTFDRDEYVDKRWLAPGTQYFSVGSSIGAYDEQAPGVNFTAGSMRLLHKIGSKRAVEMAITGNAQRLKLEGIKGLMPDLSESFTGAISKYLDPKNPEFLMAIGVNNGLGKIDPNKGVSVVTMLEVLLYRALMLQTERQLMYGRGGQGVDQRNQYKLTADGLYHQMKLGNWVKIPKYTKDVITGILSQVFKNRPDIADVDRHITFQGGRGAVIELTRIFTQEGAAIAQTLGAVLNNASLGGGIVQGSDAYHLKAGFRFTEIFLAGFGHVKIEHNPALDSEFSRAMDEERIGGYPKFSYTCIVMDVTDESATNAYSPSKDVKFAQGFDNKANIYLVKNEGLPGIKYSYQNGRTSPYPVSAGKGNVVSTMFDGYKCFLEEQSSIWLRDPGRTILVQLK